MSSHRVLITAIGGNVAQGVLKSLRASRLPFHIVGIDMEPLSAGFSLVDRHYCTPRTSDPAFANALAQIVRDERLEAIYVCSPTELEFFSSHQNDLECELGAAVFVNPPDVIRVGSDKLATAGFLRDHGFPFPETVRASDADGITRLIERHGFPLVVKPRAGFSSRNVFLVKTREEIEAARTLVPDLIAQQYLPDDRSEYTAATLSDGAGRVGASIILRRDLLQGTTYRTELVEDRGLDEHIVSIVQALGAIGPCNLQFRIVNGVPYVFEINPRFSGTSGIRYLYGFNDSEMIFRLLRLGEMIEQPALSRNVVLRYWNEICIPAATFQDLREGRVAHKGFVTTISGVR